MAARQLAARQLAARFLAARFLAAHDDERLIAGLKDTAGMQMAPAMPLVKPTRFRLARSGKNIQLTSGIEAANMIH
ncbi:MAG TPA: hypothetical protein VF739_02415 [Ktedonobacterales bacterium]